MNDPSNADYGLTPGAGGAFTNWNLPPIEESPPDAVSLKLELMHVDGDPDRFREFEAVLVKIATYLVGLGPLEALMRRRQFMPLLRHKCQNPAEMLAAAELQIAVGADPVAQGRVAALSPVIVRWIREMAETVISSGYGSQPLAAKDVLGILYQLSNLPIPGVRDKAQLLCPEAQRQARSQLGRRLKGSISRHGYSLAEGGMALHVGDMAVRWTTERRRSHAGHFSLANLYAFQANPHPSPQPSPRVVEAGQM